MKILVTGSAGFIGLHIVQWLLRRDDDVTGLDNINNYYDVRLKYSRLNTSGIIEKEIQYNKMVSSRAHKNYRFIQLDLSDRENIQNLFKNNEFQLVIHMAAQAGVRYSIENPYAYLDSNLAGFLNILEGCRNTGVKHLIFASSSSVYGLNEKMPFSVRDPVDHPVSLYGATKKTNELMAHVYSHLYDIPSTGLRFFTVYGPWGRPDMAYFLFTKAILEGKPIHVFNRGHMQRDFTYIDDIIRGILKVVDSDPIPDSDWNGKEPEPASSKAPYRIYNIGRGEPVNLMDFISILEKQIGKKAKMKRRAMQPGDVVSTWADTSELEKAFHYHPNTSLEEGIQKFLDWYLNFYKGSLK